jgi:plasmid stability protein
MKNITVSIDDETHRAARIRAAELGTSVSALVKGYLAQIAADRSPTGVVQEERAGFEAAPAAGQKGPEGQPYFVDGRWVWTRDGKPRPFGALKGKLWVADDFDEWPEGFLDAMLGEDTEASNTWWVDANKILEDRRAK